MGWAGWFVDRVVGDPSNVIGLSLPLLRRILAAAEVSIAELWKRSAHESTNQ
jgi:septum formation protein